MAIKSINDMPRGKEEINLNGPDGNVFVLMAKAKRYAQQLHMDGDAICADMMSSNYEHAVRVFDDAFGEYVILYR